MMLAYSMGVFGYGGANGDSHLCHMTGSDDNVLHPIASIMAPSGEYRQNLS